MSEQITLKDCKGCCNDFYNYRKNCNGKFGCWSFDSAEIVVVYEIHRDTPQDNPSRFRKCKRPSCYKSQDVYHYRQLPEHLRTLND